MAEPGREARSLLPLAVRDLVFSAGDRGPVLIDRLDLDIADTGITVIMGPNGAGKSMLVRLLHGLLQPTAGTISWNGCPMVPDVRARQAMVFQKPVLLRRSVIANIDFVLALRPARNRATALQCLEDAGLAAKARQQARSLSGGEQQRLALARALATEPEVLFLDEPTASLDPASTLAIEERLLATRKAGVKVIMVTHDIGQARRLAEDVVFLHRGRVIEHTEGRRFFTEPESEQARAYQRGSLIL